MNKAGKKGIAYGVSAALLLLVAGAVAFAFSIPGFGKFEKVQAANGYVTVAVSKVSDGKAHFFTYADGGKNLNFFVVKGSDGQLHTAFDACDVCYREKKGYTQQGDQMVCTNCNQKFAIVRIGAASAGGCNPSHLPARVDAASVKIGVADLKAGARFF